MKTVLSWLLIPLVMFLAGCESAFTTKPMGDTVVQLSPEEWQGTWLHPDLVLTTHVLDIENGRIQASWMERESEGVKIESIEGSVRSAGDLLYIVTRDEHQPEFYHWARIEKGSNYVLMWVPNIEQLKLRIEDGSLPGKITEDGVVLENLERSHLEMIDDPSAHLLNWKDPDIFIRVTD